MAVKQSLLFLALALLVTLGECRFKQWGTLEYGEPCGAKTLDCCNSKDFTDPLDCSDAIEGVCICMEGLIRDTVLNKCVSPPNSGCTVCTSPHPHYKFQCAPFSECVQEDRSKSCDALVDAKRPGKIDGVCQCVPGATIDMETGLCACPHGELIDGTCKLLAGQGNCTTGATCTQNADCLNAICTCKNNFAEDNTGHCIQEEVIVESSLEKLVTEGSPSLVQNFITLTTDMISSIANL